MLTNLIMITISQYLNISNHHTIHLKFTQCYLSIMGSMVKDLCANAGATGDSDLISESGRPPGGGNSNPLQYSCLNFMNIGAWWATVHGVAEPDMTE